MTEYGNQEGDLLTCSCCGRGITHNEHENADYGKVPYPDDQGFGLCLRCGGDKRSRKIEDGDTPEVIERKARKRLGWAACGFYDARIELLFSRLAEKNRARFEAMTYPERVNIVIGLVQRGVII